MKKGIEASNLRRSDIEAVSSYDYKKYEHYKGEFTTDEENIDRNYTTQFGEKCKSEKNVTCPAIWTEVDSKWKYEYDDEKGQSGINNEKETWESEGTSEIRKKESTTVKSTDIELKESMYYHRYEKDEFSEDYFDLIFGDFSQYWLNSRSVAFDRNMDAFRYKLYCSVVKKIQL